MTEIETERLAYSLDDVAKRLGGVTRRFVEVLVATGDLPSIKVRGRRLVAAADLNAYIEQLRKDAALARESATRGAA